MWDPETMEFDRDCVAPGKYMVCIGGYPTATLDSFADAADRAREMVWRHPDGDFSIYEIETGIHFDLPRASHPENDFMAILHRLADESFQAG